MANQVVAATSLTQLPFGRFEYVRVAFGTANTDMAVEHHLQAPSPNQVCYIVVQQSAAGSVYVDNSVTRRLWTSTAIYLRSNTANLIATLLLFTPVNVISTIHQ